jgi:hypothetical protein
MSRGSYKVALRAKGLKPIPPAHRLRSSLTVAGSHIISPRCELPPAPIVLSVGGRLLQLVKRS